MFFQKEGKIKALILLGGFGTRLRPFTLTTPKSLLPVANRPLLQYQLFLLSKYGIDTVILAIGQHCKKHKEVFSIAKETNIKIYLSLERNALGTAGGIKNASKFLRGEKEFFVFNGDIVSDCNLGEMLDFHRKKGSFATICAVRVKNPSAFGVIDIDGDRRIRAFVEKPEQPVSNIINAGIYIFQSDILGEIPDGKETSIEKETFPELIKKEKDVYTFVHNGYWIDVGTIENYRRANFDAINLRFGSEERKKDTVPTELYKNICIQGNLITGKDVVLGDGVEIKGDVIIGDGCYVGSGTIIQDSVLFKKVMIGKNCHVSQSIIGNSVIIEDNCRIENCAIADISRLCQFSKIADI